MVYNGPIFVLDDFDFRFQCGLGVNHQPMPSDVPHIQMGQLLIDLLVLLFILGSIIYVTFVAYFPCHLGSIDHFLHNNYI